MPTESDKSFAITDERLRRPIRLKKQTLSDPAGLKKAPGIERLLRLSNTEMRSGRFRIPLYRFMTENIPLLSACLWTWVRLTAAPGHFEAYNKKGERDSDGERQLELMSGRIGKQNQVNQGISFLLRELLGSLFCDGLTGGFITVKSDRSGIDKFIPLDSSRIILDREGKKPGLYYETDQTRIFLERPDFYYLPLNNSSAQPLGQSIFQAVPFISYIEQQLVDDMRRSSHNSGYHRLHVKITPPERIGGESDQAFIDRINSYFDSTVSMIRSCDVDDNPVTWDNVEIEHIGPASSSSRAGNNWFFSHRSMIEDICAGTNLAPFLLGYSYGATNTWSAFKFDVVMRQVRSIQAEISTFLEWLGRIELALTGYNLQCRYIFDNSFNYQALDQISIESGKIDNLLKLYQAGLIDRDQAKIKAGAII